MCRIIISDLKLAGFTIDEESSILQPTQQGICLGFLIDTNSFTLTVPECKIKDMISEMTKTVTRKTTTAREIARIAGNLYRWNLQSDHCSSNGYRIKPNHAITKIVFSDASNHSIGGFIIKKMGNVIAHDSLTPN